MLGYRFLLFDIDFFMLKLGYRFLLFDIPPDSVAPCQPEEKQHDLVLRYPTHQPRHSSYKSCNSNVTDSNNISCNSKIRT